MKILVIDDKATNRKAAEQTITGHDLTVVGSWDEAVELLGIRYDEQAIKAKLMAEGLPPTFTALTAGFSQPWTEENKQASAAWWEAHDRIEAENRIPYWDAVLCDLLMPASRESMGDKGLSFVGQEMPLGLALALLAALNGAKYVAVVTATNHHHHPASAMLDRLSSAYWDKDFKPNFVINGARAMFVHHPSYCVEGILCPTCQGTKYTNKVCSNCEGTGQQGHYNQALQRMQYTAGTVCERCDGTKKSPCGACAKTGKAEAKHWGKVLARLLGESVEDDETEG